MKKLFTTLCLTVATVLGLHAQDVSYQVFPAPGSVNDLEEISVAFPGTFDELEIGTADDITLKKDGELIPTQKVTEQVDGGIALVVKFERQTAAGTYVLDVTAGNLILWSNGYESMTEVPAISATYTIAGGEVEPPVEKNYFEVSADPAQGEYDQLKTITFTFPNLADVDLDVAPTVTKDGADFADFSAAKKAYESNEIVVTFSGDNGAPAGEYVINFEANALTGYADLTDEGYAFNEPNPEAMAFTYTVKESSSEPVVPVEYTLGLAFNQPRPNAQGEINIADRDLSFMTFLSDASELKAKEGAQITVEGPEGFSVTAELKDRGAWGTKTMFGATFSQTPTYNGVYTLKVAQGSFGDAAWIANNETGVSNAEVVLTFTAVGGQSGILDIKADAQSDKTVYNLQGIKVADSLDSLPSGLYIVGGKKISK